MPPPVIASARDIAAAEMAGFITVDYEWLKYSHMCKDIEINLRIRNLNMYQIGCHFLKNCKEDRKNELHIILKY